LLSRSPTLILSHAAYNNSSERRLSEAAGETVTAPARWKSRKAHARTIGLQRESEQLRYGNRTVRGWRLRAGV